MVPTGIRPSDFGDFFTHRESGLGEVFTIGKVAAEDSASDKVSGVECEDSRFTWCDFRQDVGATAPLSPLSTPIAGIMSTCGTTMQVQCSWCRVSMGTKPGPAGMISHSMCPRCSATFNAELDILEVERTIEETARARRAA